MWQNKKTMEGLAIFAVRYYKEIIKLKKQMQLHFSHLQSPKGNSAILHMHCGCSHTTNDK
jgi:hypothetical protein